MGTVISRRGRKLNGSRVQPDGSVRIPVEDLPTWLPEPPAPSYTPHLIFLSKRYGAAFGVLVILLVSVVGLMDPGTALEEQQAAADLIREITRSTSNVSGDDRFGGQTTGPGEPVVADLALISVFTEPDGARVLVDDEPVGLTPLNNFPLEQGAYIVSVEMEGHEARDTVVVILSTDERLDLSFDLFPGAVDPSAIPLYAERESLLPQAAPEQASDAAAEVVAAPQPVVGSLLIVSSPEGATVRQSGRVLGQTPLLLQDLAPGSHTYVVAKAGHDSREVRAQVRPDATTTLRAALPVLEGQVSVLVRPWGTIYIDGELFQRDTDILHTATLPVGRHTIRAVHRTLGEREQVVDVGAGDEQRVVIYFEE